MNLLKLEEKDGVEFQKNPIGTEIKFQSTERISLTWIRVGVQKEKWTQASNIQQTTMVL